MAAPLDFDYREVRSEPGHNRKRAKVILVADRLKLERAAPVKICTFVPQIHTFITDSLTSAELRDLCATALIRPVSVKQSGLRGIRKRENSAA